MYPSFISKRVLFQSKADYETVRLHYSHVNAYVEYTKEYACMNCKKTNVLVRTVLFEKTQLSTCQECSNLMFDVAKYTAEEHEAVVKDNVAKLEAELANLKLKKIEQKKDYEIQKKDLQEKLMKLNTQ